MCISHNIEICHFVHITNHIIVGTKKVMGTNHKVNSPKISHIFLDGDGAVLFR